MKARGPKTACARGWTIAASCVVVIICAGCGGGRKDEVIALVEGRPITSRQMIEWMRWQDTEHFVPDPPRYVACMARNESLGELSVGNALKEECETQYAVLKAKALRFLISSYWLIGEAGTHAMWVGLERVPADLGELRNDRRLAVREVERELRSREAPATNTKVLRYYKEHISKFESRERRYFDIVEHLPNKGVGRHLMERLATGHRIANGIIEENLYRPRVGEAVLPEKQAITEAIFAARPDIYVGPVPLEGLFAFFRVTRIMPRRVEPLSRARGSVERQLSQDEHRSALTRFLRDWHSHWQSRTVCMASYVTPDCRNFGGASGTGEVPEGLH
jgi:hypothetical protein